MTADEEYSESSTLHALSIFFGADLYKQQPYGVAEYGCFCFVLFCLGPNMNQKGTHNFSELIKQELDWREEKILEQVPVWTDIYGI